MYCIVMLTFLQVSFLSKQHSKGSFHFFHNARTWKVSYFCYLVEECNYFPIKERKIMIQYGLLIVNFIKLNQSLELSNVRHLSLFSMRWIVKTCLKILNIEFQTKKDFWYTGSQFPLGYLTEVPYFGSLVKTVDMTVKILLFIVEEDAWKSNYLSILTFSMLSWTEVFIFCQSTEV